MNARQRRKHAKKWIYKQKHKPLLVMKSAISTEQVEALGKAWCQTVGSSLSSFRTPVIKGSIRKSRLEAVYQMLKGFGLL